MDRWSNGSATFPKFLAVGGGRSVPRNTSLLGIVLPPVDLTCSHSIQPGLQQLLHLILATSCLSLGGSM
jgi:hypothetical protein